MGKMFAAVRGICRKLFLLSVESETVLLIAINSQIDKLKGLRCIFVPLDSNLMSVFCLVITTQEI